jgi:hypothetical protein
MGPVKPKGQTNGSTSDDAEKMLIQTANIIYRSLRDQGKSHDEALNLARRFIRREKDKTNWGHKPPLFLIQYRADTKENKGEFMYDLTKLLTGLRLIEFLISTLDKIFDPKKGDQNDEETSPLEGQEPVDVQKDC